MLITPLSPWVAHRRAWHTDGLSEADLLRLAQIRASTAADCSTPTPAKGTPTQPCPACGGLGFRAPRPVGWAAEVCALRRAEVTAVDQCHVDLPSLLRRLTMMCALRPMTSTRVVFVGDDDLASVALLRHAPPDLLLVIDMDQQVLNTVEAEARGRGLTGRVVTEHVDITARGTVDALVDRHGESFDMAVTDPPYAEGGMRTFVALACRLLTFGGEIHIAVPALLAEAWSDELMLMVQADLTASGFVIERLQPGMFTYTSSDVVSSLVVARRVAGTRFADRPIVHGLNRFYTTRAPTGAVDQTVLTQSEE